MIDWEKVMGLADDALSEAEQARNNLDGLHGENALIDYAKNNLIIVIDRLQDLIQEMG